MVRARFIAPLSMLALAVGGCTSTSQGVPVGTVNVVAAENFWGSIASQLGGASASVQSVVTDPNADPHEYESSTNDARAFADADLVILNGAGYDDWGKRLLDANPSSHRTVIDVARLLGKKAGDNPHFWYSPDYVARVADQITSAFKAIDGRHTADFDRQRSEFAAALQPYTDRIGEIKSRFGGTPVGSTESVFSYLAIALGLDLVSPPEFMDAVSQGNDPSVAAVIAFQTQLTGHQVRLLVYNVQTITAVTSNVRSLAAAHGIPVVGISETMQPQTARFQDWQLAQLDAIERALGASA
jgi:zinc/manganese transport system substrate-binding protein